MKPHADLFCRVAASSNKPFEPTHCFQLSRGGAAQRQRYLRFQISCFGCGFVLSSIFVLCGCKADKTFEFDEVAALKSAPISSLEQAAGFAKATTFTDVNVPFDQLRSAGFDSWQITAKTKDDRYGTYWFVTLHVSGMIPGFSCATAFDAAGLPVTDDSARCEFNK